MTKTVNLLKSKRGLSNAVSTLIILVVSVLLATVVTYYAINITSTRVQEEAVNIQKMHVWVNNTVKEAAFVITNTGGKDILLDKIAVRGVESDWTNVYYWKATTTVTSDLAARREGNLTKIIVQGSYKTFTQGSTDLHVASGETFVIYIKDPDSITVNDVGTTVSLTVYTANAEYLEESNVESATPNP